MQALVRGALACAVVLWCAIAQADVVKHPSGFSFNLPDIGKNWEQEKKGDLFIVSDESDTLPELTVFVFPAKQEGTLEQIQARLQSEIARPGVSLDGEAIKTVSAVTSASETIADATAVRGTCTLNKTKAAFAIVQRNGKSLILVGVPKEGIFDRGNVNFREIIKGLQKGAGATVAAAKPVAPPVPDSSKNIVKMMPSFIIVKDVTATSTFVDKKHKDAYAPLNVIWHDVVEDEEVGIVPKTAWCEGKPDEGIGETLTINFARPEQIDDISIAAGVWLNQKLFNANNQITALDVSVDGKVTTLKPTASREAVELKIGKPVSTIAIKIASVKKGKMNDTCISDVSLHRKGDTRTVDAKELSPEQLAALPANLAAIQAALVAPSYAALQNVLVFPFNYNFAWGPKKVKYANWKSLEAVCKATKTRDESSKCPSGLFFKDDRADTTLQFQTSTTGDLSIEFPQEGGWYDIWRLKWRDGSWRLSAIDGIKQRRD